MAQIIKPGQKITVSGGPSSNTPTNNQNVPQKPVQTTPTKPIQNTAIPSNTTTASRVSMMNKPPLAKPLPPIPPAPLDDSLDDDDDMYDDYDDGMGFNDPMQTPYSGVGPTGAGRGLGGAFNPASYGAGIGYGMPPANKPAQATLTKMTEDQRKEVIRRIFSLVLGKEATEKDFSFYRYSTLTEEGLLKNLLNLPEHKQAMERSKEYPELKKIVSDLEIRYRQTEEGVKALQQEVYTMQQLLIEKNKHIVELRNLLRAPMSPEERAQIAVRMPVPIDTVRILPREEEAQQQEYDQISESPLSGTPGPINTEGVQNPISNEEISQEQGVVSSQPIQRMQLASPMDEVKNIFRDLFGLRRK